MDTKLKAPESPALNENDRLAKQKTDNQRLKMDQIQQVADTGKLKTIKANKNSKFEINESDKDHVVIYCAKRSYDNDKKREIVSAQLLPIWPRQLKQMIADGAFYDFDDVEIVHVPANSGISVDTILQPKEMGPEGTETELSKRKDGAVSSDELARREQVATIREKQLDEKMAEIDRKLAMLGGGSSESADADKVDPKNLPGATTGGAARVTEEEKKGNLPKTK